MTARIPLKKRKGYILGIPLEKRCALPVAVVALGLGEMRVAACNIECMSIAPQAISRGSR